MFKKKKIIPIKNLIGILREIDLERNDIQTIREVLDFVVDNLEKIEKENKK